MVTTFHQVGLMPVSSSIKKKIYHFVNETTLLKITATIGKLAHILKFSISFYSSHFFPGLEFLIINKMTTFNR